MFDFSNYQSIFAVLIILLILGAVVVGIFCHESAKATAEPSRGTEVAPVPEEPLPEAPIADPDPEIVPGLRESLVRRYVLQFLTNNNQDMVIDLREALGQEVATLEDYVKIQDDINVFLNRLQSDIREAGWDYQHSIPLGQVARDACMRLTSVWKGPVQDTQRLLRLPVHLKNNCSDSDPTEFPHRRGYLDAVLKYGYFGHDHSVHTLALTEGALVDVKVTATMPSVRISWIGPQLAAGNAGKELVVDADKTYPVYYKARETEGGQTVVDYIYTSPTSGVEEVQHPRVLNFFVPDEKPVITTSATTKISVDTITPEVLEAVEALGNQVREVQVYRARGYLNISLITDDKSVLISDRYAYFYSSNYRDVDTTGKTLVDQVVDFYKDLLETDSRLHLITADNEVLWFHDQRRPTAA